MRQETFAILFLMRKGRPKKNGLAPIFARITTGGLRQEVYTQCDSNPETWNQHKERAMGTNKLAIQVNERLNDFRVKIIDIRTSTALRPASRIGRASKRRDDSDGGAPQILQQYAATFEYTICTRTV